MPPSLVALAEIMALAVLAFVIARGFWFLMYGAFSEPFTFDEPETVSSVREARLTPTDTSFETLFSGTASAASTADIQSLPETQLSLRLFGVRMGETPESGSAIIEAGANGQRSYAVGQFITEVASLAEVHADRIVIDRGGVREVLFLREGAAGSSGASGLQPVSDPQALIGQLGLQPNFDSGELNGFRVSNDSAAARALGLERGDVILAINGRNIPQDVEAARRILTRLQTANSVQMTVRREGERIMLDIPQ
ncbi:type II secretion system protein N [Hyphobacterium sp.]|uniref:type II secretion system protein N n=1 Tax=Hyphobacterium sp. TaxID=2004662 RepID=UPI003BA9B1B3